MYGAGCKECVYSGYLGRTAIFEILTMTDELRRMIVAGAGNQDIQATALSQGLVTIAKDGMMKAKAGITTPMKSSGMPLPSLNTQHRGLSYIYVGYGLWNTNMSDTRLTAVS